MTTKVEEAGGPLREFARDVADSLAVSEAEYRVLYAPRVGGLGFRVDADDVGRRAAWAIVAQWLLGYAVQAIEAKATLAEAESWFLGEIPNLPRVAPHRSGAEILSALSADEAFALLPYLLDPLAPATRRCVLRNGDLRADRETRKASGVYYTPADLAHYMACTARASEAETCFDPACGTGVFLRATRARGAGTNTPLLFGCDIEQLAVEQCAFVLASSDLTQMSGRAPWTVWHTHRVNLACTDSLLLTPGSALNDVDSRRRSREIADARRALRAGEDPGQSEDQEPTDALGDLFPDLTAGAEVLLCNPPYSRLGRHPQRKRITRLYQSFGTKPAGPGSETSTPFVEHVWRLTLPGTGRGAVVVPLSLAFSTTKQFCDLRNAMASTPGHWKYAFFDRTPDALFGDDVKTRNAVVIYDAAGSDAVETTSLLRWTSRNRPEMWNRISHTRVTSKDATSLLPKIGSAAEARLYAAVRELGGTLGADFVSDNSVCAADDAKRLRANVVYAAPTAYNWLNLARSLISWRDTDSSSSSPFTRIELTDARSADATYALLSSRLIFWLWRVEADAFHLTRAFLRGLPFALRRLATEELSELADLGASLWHALEPHPVISINKGKKTFAFPAQREPRIIDLIDDALIQAFGLTHVASGFDLRAWYEGTVVVNMNEPKRVARLAYEGEARA